MPEQLDGTPVEPICLQREAQQKAVPGVARDRQGRVWQSVESGGSQDRAFLRHEGDVESSVMHQ